MSSLRISQRACLWAACLIAATAPSVLAAPLDAATVLPQDTLIYVGWSNVLEPEQCDVVVKAATQIIDSVGEFDEDERTLLEDVMKIAATAVVNSGGAGLTDLAAVEGMPNAHVAVVLDAGDDAVKLALSIRELIIAAGPHDIAQTVVAEHTFQATALEGLSLMWGAADGRLIVVLGTTPGDAVAAGLLADGEKLAANPRFAAARKKVDSAPTPKACLFIDAPGMLDAIRNLSRDAGNELDEETEKTLEAVGVTGVEALYVEVADNDLGLSTRIFIDTQGERRGLLKLWDAKPLSKADLQLVPRDAVWCMAFNLDVAQLLTDVVEMLKAIDPQLADDYREAQAQITETIGFDPQTAPWDALGDTWLLYDAPAQCNFLKFGAVLVGEVRNAKALRATFDKLLEFAREQSPPCDLKTLTRKRGDLEIIQLVLAGLPSPFVPSACFVGDHVVVGLTPQSVAVAAERLQGATPDDSFLSRPDVKQTWSKLPRNLQSVYYSDNQQIMRMLFGVRHLAMTAVASFTASPEFNPGQLPTLPEVVDAWGVGLGGWSCDDDGLLYVSYGPALASPVDAAPLWIPAWATILGAAQEASESFMVTPVNEDELY